MKRLLLSFTICLFAVILYNTANTSQIKNIASRISVIPYLTRSNTLQRSNTTSLPALHISRSASSSSSQLSNMTSPRQIQKAFLAIEQSEGVGARVRRSIGTPQLRNFTPFLMLDHFSVAQGAGFGDHFHRGFGTVTLMLGGASQHEDFAGNKGDLEEGDLQFMTAGKGIMHAEMPRPNPNGTPNVGLQLWVDLPQKLKYMEPRYRDLKASEIPNIEVDDGKVKIKVISGESHGTESAKELAETPMWMLQFKISPGGKVNQPLPVGWNAFAYTLSGSTAFGAGKDQTTIGQYHNVVFKQEGDSVVAEVASDATEDGHFVLFAGLPLDQEIVQYGPIVMNTQEEIYEAMLDIQSHQNGFERAAGWESEIAKSLAH